MSIKNTQLGGTDWIYGESPLASADLNDTFDAVQDCFSMNSLNAFYADEKTAFDIANGAGHTNCIIFKSDGTKLYIEDDTQIIYQYSLSTAWDLSTLTADNINYDHSVVSGSVCKSIIFNSDGTKMFILNTTGDTYQYTLGTGWNVSTASYDTKSYDATEAGAVSGGMFLDSSGTKLYVASNSNDAIYQYTLSSAWDISTASYDSKSLDLTGTPVTIWINSDLNRLYVNTTTDLIYTYKLTTAGDISTGILIGKTATTAFDTDPKGIYVRETDDEHIGDIYVSGETNKDIYLMRAGKL